MTLIDILGPHGEIIASIVIGLIIAAPLSLLWIFERQTQGYSSD